MHTKKLFLQYFFSIIILSKMSEFMIENGRHKYLPLSNSVDINEPRHILLENILVVAKCVSIHGSSQP